MSESTLSGTLAGLELEDFQPSTLDLALLA
jgi:hypothetical protein